MYKKKIGQQSKTAIGSDDGINTRLNLAAALRMALVNGYRMANWTLWFLERAKLWLSPVAN